MTICMNCNNRVHTAPGFCTVCGTVFVASTIARQVAPSELNYMEELKWYARVVGGLDKAPRVTVTLSLAA